MSTTPNYNLILCDDDNKLFKDWRNEMNGTGDSNMKRIDRALADKADSSVIITATLLSSAWKNTGSSYTQELLVSGITETTNGVINIAHNASIEQRDAVRGALISVLSQEEGKLVVIADGKLPESDIPVYILLLD